MHVSSEITKQILSVIGGTGIDIGYRTVTISRIEGEVYTDGLRRTFSATYDPSTNQVTIETLGEPTPVECVGRLINSGSQA